MKNISNTSNSYGIVLLDYTIGQVLRINYSEIMCKNINMYFPHTPYAPCMSTPLGAILQTSGSVSG